jgi:hypothetical protein
MSRAEKENQLVLSLTSKENVLIGSLNLYFIVTLCTTTRNTTDENVMLETELN